MIKSNTPFNPGDVNFREDRIVALDSFFRGMIDDKIIDGSIYCLSRDGRMFAHASDGKLSYEAEDLREMQPDSIFRIASMTKLFVAVSIFQLVDDGKLALNQEVATILPEFGVEPFKQINISHLLTHTSGIAPDPGTVPDTYYKSAWWYIYETKMEDDNWIKAGLSYGLRFQPGEQWMYSSFGYVLLGEIITRVSGVFAEDYIMENIVKPLGMEDTFFELPAEKAHRVSVRYERQKKYLENLQNGTLPVEEKTVFDTIPSTGGGMYSTVKDMEKFGTMLLQKGIYGDKYIVSRMSIEKMTKRFNNEKLPNYAWGAGGVDRAYGLGPDMRYNVHTTYSEASYFHEGSGACALIIDPVERLVAVWVVPVHENEWSAKAVYNTQNVIWSGLI